MSGHSKWSKVKHQKAQIDAVKGKLFTKAASAIIIAVKEGGGIADPATNFKLRLAIEKAREVNTPKENIDRAIQKGKGQGGGAGLETVVYEAFGPRQTVMIIEGATDNHQRTTANLKNILDRGGGRLATRGAVKYLFDYIGEIAIAKEGKSYDDVMAWALDSYGEDVREEDDRFVIETKPNLFHQALVGLGEKGANILSSDLVYKPKSEVRVESGDRDKVISFLESIEDADDIHKVHTNAVFS